MVALGSGLAACSSGSSPSTSSDATTPSTSQTASPAASVHWVKCKGGAGPAKFQCATILVPRDPQNPARGTISMALDRRPASGPKIGSLLVNPGGPGVSGVDELPTIVAAMPSSLLARFDVVGFDPPGVDRTAPITCLNSAGLAHYFHADPAPASQAGINTMLADDRAFAQGCESLSGAELPFVSTVDAAMDMDVIRKDLGDSKLTYLGFSYGTFLGATYADLYPTHLRAMVLDGTLDPALPVLTVVEQQSASLDSQLHQFFAACRASPGCPWKPGPDPAAAFNALLARVRTSPLPVPHTSRTVGPAEFLFGVAWGLYFTDTWGFLAAALNQAGHDNGQDLLKLFDNYTGRNADGTYSNLFEANAAIDCLDAPAPTLAAIQAAMPTVTAEAPVFGRTELYGAVGCTLWPVAATGKVGPIHAAGAPPIVVVGSTGDPITPYAWAQDLARQLDSGVLITRVGDGHTAYQVSPCIRNDVDRYLIDLTPPAAGTRCPTG
jgi:pimeloyl-ACP methyl ester carboxylesterase